MTERTTFPNRVQVVPHTWIPTRDGTRLAARMWMPEDTQKTPVPAILEYIPYRKNDATAARDLGIHPYFAGFGYASVRVDIRGSGDSDGLLEDEYLPTEQLDAVDVISWLSRQPWCNGSVGMIGKSWGGFNGLQVASHAPPELKAVISICSTDDRYADDVHFEGGCLVACEMLSWATTMLAYNARPPDPHVVGEGWRESWFERLERTPPFVESWLRHQRRDDFWKQGSVCEDFSQITCPVYMVGGWADGYRNAIFRFLEGYAGPRKGLIGPWSHNYPQDGIPGPAIGFLQECLRWWDYWLKGVETGIMDEPELRAWMQDAVRPASFYATRNGRWIAEPSWPVEGDSKRLYLTQEGLRPGAGTGSELAIGGMEAHGVDAGAWSSFGNPGELPCDQRGDDGRAFCFDSEPLSEPLELLGFPSLTVTLSADRPLGLLALRLCDVWPDGASALISRGLFNLTHRESHEEPSQLNPSERFQVTVPLKSVGYAIPAGHRIRLAASTSYWPLVWPSPEHVTLTLVTGDESYLSLPVRRSRETDAALADFDPPEASSVAGIEVLRTPATYRRVMYDAARGRWKIDVGLDYFGSHKLRESGLEYDETGLDTFSISDGEPLSAEARSRRTITLARESWRPRIACQAALSATADEFSVTNALQAYEAEEQVFSSERAFTVPRDFV